MIPSSYLDGFRPPVDPSVLIDATGWLEQPACWPALLYTVGGSRTAARAFDLDLADLDVMLDELDRSDRWPVFTAELHSGYQVHLVWRNFAGDSGWDYVLSHPASGQLTRLASLEGSFNGPALSWPELIAVAQLPDPQLTRAERFLLMLPAMSDTGMPPDAATIVAKAVRAVGATRKQTDIANELLAANRRFWGPVEWRDSDGVLICLGNHSKRRIDSPWAERQMVMAALGTG